MDNFGVFFPCGFMCSGQGFEYGSCVITFSLVEDFLEFCGSGAVEA